MPTRTDSADPRATRVRERIKEAAFALVEQHRVEDISVRDVVTAAEVSRQVFYGHFRDRDDAVAQAVTDSFAEHFGDTTGRELPELAQALFDYIEEHAALYRNLYPSAASEQTANAFRALLLPACTAAARQIAPDPGAPADTLAHLLLGGIIEVTRHCADLRAENGAAPDLRAARRSLDATLRLLLPGD